MFVSNLNSKLLAFCLNHFAFIARWRLNNIIDYINEGSKRLFEPRGFKLSLWLIESDCSQSESEVPLISEQQDQYYVLSQDYLKRRKDIMLKLIKYW